MLLRRKGDLEGAEEAFIAVAESGHPREAARAERSLQVVRKELRRTSLEPGGPTRPAPPDPYPQLDEPVGEGAQSDDNVIVLDDHDRVVGRQR